jgi:hypothetical protein
MVRRNRAGQSAQLPQSDSQVSCSRKKLLSFLRCRWQARKG